MLPLVVLGMLLFTYVFVSQLPGTGPDVQADNTTDASTDVTTGSTLPDGSEDTTPSDSTAPDVAPPDAGPEVEAYRMAMTALESELTAFNTELDQVNDAWDAEPRDIEYSAAEETLTDISERVSEWSDRVAAVQAPASLAEAHNGFVAAAASAGEEAAAVLDGLVNAPGPEPRRDAAGRFDAARTAFAESLASVA